MLSRASRLEVYNIGGTVSPVTRGQEGDWAVHEMQRLHVDVSVVCPAGVSVERGLTQATPAAAAVSQVEVASGQRVIALANSADPGHLGLRPVRRDSTRSTCSPSPARPARPRCAPFPERGVAVDVG